jgi:hypothetical protein
MVEASGTDFTASAAVAYCLLGRDREDMQSEQIRGDRDDPIQI